MNFQDKNIKWIFVFFGAIFFVVYLFLYWPGSNQKDHLILNQPDEAANYFFIKNLVFNHDFGSFESYSILSDNQIRPRSTTVVNSTIKPISFPGIIILYSLFLSIFVKLFGGQLFNFLAVSITPLIAIVTPFFLYKFLANFFEKKVAWISGLMLYILPAWWYYASRPFQHNLLFTSSLVFALYFGSRLVLEIKNNKKALWAFLTGIFFALPIYIRASELVWVAILVIILSLFFFKKINFRNWVFLGSGVLLVIILFFTTQILFYGNPLGSGYVKSAVDGTAGIVLSGPQGINFFQSLVLPFGFNLENIARNFRNYGGTLFGWWFVFAALGVVYEAWNWFKNKKINWYLLIYLSLSAYLFVFYGSWKFFDNLLQMPSIGTSYVRYFLPIYVFSLPFLTKLILDFSIVKKGRWLVLLLIFSGLFLNSFYTVYFSLEGLRPIRNVIKKYSAWQDRIYQNTEEDSVIAARYSDKYLFPGRKIISNWNYELEQQGIKKLLENNVPVYWFDLSADRNFPMSGLELSEQIITLENLELRKLKLK